jgi:phage gp16-like protein
MEETTKTPEERRKAELAQIHIAKVELGMAEEDYRFTLQYVTGVESAGKLDFMGRQKLLMHFRGLGWKPGLPGESKTQKPGRKRPELGPQQKKIWALWFDLHAKGAVKNKSAPALNAFVKRTTNGGCERLEWLTAAQANVVIEALKDWQGRVKK